MRQPHPALLDLPKPKRRKKAAPRVPRRTPRRTIALVARAKRSTTAVSRRRTWRSHCGRYHLLESVRTVGPRMVVWYALGATLADLLSSHRTRKAAVRAIERHAAEHAEIGGVL